jgi:acyl-CoA thioesterase-1
MVQCEFQVSMVKQIGRFMTTNSPKPLTVGCVGASITEGYGCRDPSKSSYPAVLERILNEEAKQNGFANLQFQVMNFGVSGTTATSGIIDSYDRTEQHDLALKSKADFYFFLIGTNDFCRDVSSEAFIREYSSLLTRFINLEKKPRVRIVIPPPLYFSAFEKFNLEAPTAMRKVAQDLDLGEVIDAFEALGGAELRYPKQFPDGCHPNDEGYSTIARIVADRIFQELVEN